MLMLTKTHAAVVAAKDAEIALSGDRIRELLATSADLCGRVETAEARLAVFTAPRARDAKGHFMPSSKKYAIGPAA